MGQEKQGYAFIKYILKDNVRSTFSFSHRHLPNWRSFYFVVLAFGDVSVRKFL